MKFDIFNRSHGNFSVEIGAFSKQIIVNIFFGNYLIIEGHKQSLRSFEMPVKFGLISPAVLRFIGQSNIQKK